MKKIIRILSLFLLATAVIVAGFQWIETRRQQASILEAQQHFYSHVEREENNETSDLTSLDSALPLISQPQPKIPEIASLQHINSQVTGWIKIPETSIDYPIVQSNDNVFYLDHDWQREKNRAGAIFMDYRNDANALTSPSTHTILYGHHMRDGSMFQPLTTFKDFSFFQQHNTFTVTDEYQTHRFEIFSVYVTTTDFYYIETDFDNNEAFDSFISNIQEKSMHPSSLMITSDDAIITLSTCTYEYNDARLVIHARYMETLPQKGS